MLFFFSFCVQLCATPYTAAHQTPPSLGFSRQEHWSGLPFPSPMHESENVKLLSRVQHLATPWTAAYQAPQSMGVFQARVLEWVAIAFSIFNAFYNLSATNFPSLIPSITLLWPSTTTRESIWPFLERWLRGTGAKLTTYPMSKGKGEAPARWWSHSVMSDSATPRTVAYQAATSMGFSRQEYWSGLPFSSPGDLPNPGIEL